MQGFCFTADSRRAYSNKQMTASIKGEEDGMHVSIVGRLETAVYATSGHDVEYSLRRGWGMY